MSRDGITGKCKFAWFVTWYRESDLKIVIQLKRLPSATRWRPFWANNVMFIGLKSRKQVKRPIWNVERWNSRLLYFHVMCHLVSWNWPKNSYSIAKVAVRDKMAAILGKNVMFISLKSPKQVKRPIWNIERWNNRQKYFHVMCHSVSWKWSNNSYSITNFDLCYKMAAIFAKWCDVGIVKLIIKNDVTEIECQEME